jgi:transposase-like protein
MKVMKIIIFGGVLYRKEYKIKVVHLIAEKGGPISEVALELGVAQSLLHRWERKSKEGSDTIYVPYDQKLQ